MRFDKSIEPLQDMIIYLNEENTESKRFKKSPNFYHKLEVISYFEKVATSFSVTFFFQEFVLIELPGSTGVACGCSVGKKFVQEVIMNRERT